MTAVDKKAWDELKAEFAKYKQSHVFDFYDKLNEQQRQNLYQDLKVRARVAGLLCNEWSEMCE